jgi:hypothetical protein
VQSKSRLKELVVVANGLASKLYEPGVANGITGHL